jgi:hypothetical protein
MGSDKIWEHLMDLSIRCGMNQRYAQYMLSEANGRSDWIDIGVVVTTVLGAMLAVAAYFRPKDIFPVFWLPRIGVLRLAFDRLAVISSAIAAVVGIVLIVSPEREKVEHFNGMLQRWSDMRQDVDSVIVDADSERHPLGESEQAYLEWRYRELLAKKNALNAREPAPKQELLDTFLEMEEKSRGLPDKSDDVGKDVGKVAENAPVSIR